MYIIACLLIPILGIGLYPKLATQIYDATSKEITAHLRSVTPSLMEPSADLAQWINPRLAFAEAPALGDRL